MLYLQLPELPNSRSNSVSPRFTSSVDKTARKQLILQNRSPNVPKIPLPDLPNSKASSPRKSIKRTSVKQQVLDSSAPDYSPRQPPELSSSWGNSPRLTIYKTASRQSLKTKSPELQLPELPDSAGNSLIKSVDRKDGKQRHILESGSPDLPHVFIPRLHKRELTRDIIRGPEGGKPIPLSSTDRKVTVVRNAMYGNFLRKSTKKLQDDLRNTMRVYSSEKHQLLRQLANLRHEMEDLRTSNSSASPTSSISDSSRSSKSSRFFHAPNIAAKKAGGKKSKTGKMEKIKDDDQNGNNKNKDGILKLPNIANNNNPSQNSEWSSGNISQTSLPPIGEAKGIAAAKALLENNYEIPKNMDPNREDITFTTPKKSQREKKKVHFAAENKVTEFLVGDDSDESKNFIRYGVDDDIPHLRPYKHQKASKKGRYKGGFKLPPLIPLKRPNNPKEAQRVAAEYKALYVSIQNPEERTKTLADILYAVRMRMHANELNLKFGESPQPSKTDNTLCDFLLKSSSPQDDLPSPKSDTSSKNGKHYLGPLNTAARIGRRSNANQLQNYLRKMSKSRRMIEHMEAEEYRLAHIMGHKQLMAVSQAT